MKKGNWGRIAVIIGLSILFVMLPLVVACAGSTPTPTSTATPTAKPTTSPTAAPTAKSTASPTASGPTAAEFYKGKTITFMVGREAGSTTDMLARLLAPTIKELTGAGAVIVEDRPEAGGITAINLTWNAKPDGLTLNMDNLSDMALLNIFEDPAAKFNVDEFNYLWGGPTKPLIFQTSPKYRDMGELALGKGLKIASGTPGGNYHIITLIIAEIAGLDAKIWGGVSASDRALRTAQGVMDATVGNVQRTRGAVEMGVRPMITIGTERTADFPDALTIREALRPKNQMQQNAIDLSESFLIFSDTIFTSPGVPADRVEFLEKAVQDAMTKHKAEIEKMMEYSLDEVYSGADLQMLSKKFLSGEIRTGLKTWLDGLFEKYKA